MSEIPGPSAAELQQPEVQRKIGFWKSLFGGKQKELSQSLSKKTAVTELVPSVSTPAEKVPPPNRWEQAVIREHTKLEKQRQQIITQQGPDTLRVLMELGIYAVPEFSQEENTLWYDEMKKRKQNGELTDQQMQKVEEIHASSEGAAAYSDWLNEEKALKEGMIPRIRLEALYKRRPEAKVIMEKWLPIAIREANQRGEWERHQTEAKIEQTLEDKIPPRMQLNPQENEIWRQMMELKIDMGLLSAQEQEVFRTTKEKTAYEDELAIRLFDELAKEEKPGIPQGEKQPAIITPFPQKMLPVQSTEKAAA